MPRKKSTKPKESKASRTAEIGLVIGVRGTGKTTFMKKIAKEVAIERPVLVVSYANIDKAFAEYPVLDLADKQSVKSKKKGIYRAFYYKHDKKTLKYLFHYCWNYLIVMDDCRSYLDAGMLRDLSIGVIQSRHRMCDWYFVVHAFTDIPPRIFNYYNLMYLFSTSENPERAKKNIPNYDVVASTAKKINKYCKVKNNKYLCVKIENI